MNDKITECEAEGRQPNAEMPSFYEKMKQEIVSFVCSLEEEAKKYNSKI